MAERLLYPSLLTSDDARRQVLVVVWIYSPLIRIWASHVPEDEEDSEKQKHEHEHGQEHEHEHEHEHINVPTPGSTTAAAAFSLDDGKAALTAGSAGDARYGTIEADLEKGKKAGEEHAATIAAVSEIFDPRAERVFMISQVLMAIIGSFAHGANDVGSSLLAAPPPQQLPNRVWCGVRAFVRVCGTKQPMQSAHWR